MILSELLRKLSHFDSNLDVIVRGDDAIADISDVTEDFDHTDDSRFISIDLENKTEPEDALDSKRDAVKTRSGESWDFELFNRIYH